MDVGKEENARLRPKVKANASIIKAILFAEKIAARGSGTTRPGCHLPVKCIRP